MALCLGRQRASGVVESPQHVIDPQEDEMTSDKQRGESILSPQLQREGSTPNCSD